jgi:integrase
VLANRFHVLWPTSATLLLAEGWPEKIVQMRLGQVNFSMTLDLSSHVSVDLQRHAADALDATIASADQLVA